MNQRVIGKREILFFLLTAFAFIAVNIFLLHKEIPLLPATPLIVVFFLIAVNDYSLLYYFLLASLPLSFEIGFGGLSLSVPSEPLMITLTGILVLLAITGKPISKDYLKHPITTIIIFQLLLFTFNIFISVNPFLSLKYLLAKLWFYGALFVIPLYVIDSPKALKKSFWYFFIPLMLTVLYTIARHAVSAFGFEEVNEAARPFYVNHVIYACTLGLALPFVVFAAGWYRKRPLMLTFMIGCILILLFAIVTSYTRTTWLSVFAAAGSFFVFRTKLFKLSLILGVAAVIGFCVYMSHNNHYMTYAPDYQKTIFNREDFGKHMEATYNMQDVSGMERVYRWVAAVNLIKDNFWFGTGNNTFYPQYKKYANPAFVTYLSDNPEMSSTHNYFLLIFCDQGVFGVSLFVLLYLYALWNTHRIYRSSKDSFIRNAATACFLSLIIFLIHLFLGDMIEVDKNGGIFIFILSLIMILESWSRKENQKLAEQSVIK